MKRILPWLMLMVLLAGCAAAPTESPEAPLYSIDELRTMPETKGLFFSDIGTHTEPKGLLVLVFNDII